jgi:hypothetical protein
MWKVILVVLAMSPDHAILQNEEFEMKTIDDCVANVEFLMKTVPENNQNTYLAACRLEPNTPA